MVTSRLLPLSTLSAQISRSHISDLSNHACLLSALATRLAPLGSAPMTQDDSKSTFSYDGDGDPDTFSLNELRAVVDSHFGTVCSLKKLAEGGFHKVYDIVQDDGTILGVARVAAPEFPRDKTESEVATLKYIAAHTRVPVPKILSWNSDASNPVGAEYMLMEKVPGVSASKMWKRLSVTVKESVVSQVAEYLMEIFALRFDCAGSLYLSPHSESDMIVGPIISSPFYRAAHGVVRVPGADGTHLSRLRGPFSNTSDYLQISLLAELHVISHHRSVVLSDLGEEDKDDPVISLEQGERVLRKALELCSIYPGDIQIHGQEAAPTKLFSLKLDDFRLSNIMIDESGRVTGFIDFEATTVAPLWDCALLPRWLQHPEKPESSYEGGSPKSRKHLRELFLDRVGNEEWKVLHEKGKPFRLFSHQVQYQVVFWADDEMEPWVDKRLAWAKDYPGVGLFGDDFDGWFSDEGETEDEDDSDE